MKLTETSLLFKAVVNGEEAEIETRPDRTLLDILRDDLNLTGAKRGCDIGTCGSCAVIMDGKSVLSCIVPAERAQGKRIETIENLSKGGRLHPLQQAFMTAHGFQCGICTPGFIMSAKALLDKNPNPTEHQIYHAIKKNICRCTGYQQLIEAIKLAAGQIMEEDLGKGTFKVIRYSDEETESLPWAKEELNVIGKGIPKVEARTRVTGEAKYTADLKMKDALFAATVRSPYTHARIISIDTSQAERCPGVVKVLTWKDIPGENRYGKKVRDQPVFAKEKVRCIAEPVALVIAETMEIARRACNLVQVGYERLPSIHEPEEAMREDATKVHDKGNILYHYHLEKGNVEEAFREADVIVERKWVTHPQDHTPIEPEAALSYYDSDGKLVVVSPGQSVFFDRLNIIRALGLPKDDVRCIQPAIGAAYGKREDIYAQIHCALATLVTGRTVRMEYTREENILYTSKRTQLRAYLKTGIRKDGKIIAFQAKVIGDAGAYASWSVNIMRKAGVLVSGPYEIPNVQVDSYAVYTNNPMTGATRGFGATETCFCTESHIDECAHALWMDPMEFRLKNALRKNSKTSTDFQLDFFVPVEHTIKEAAKEFGWEKKMSPVVIASGAKQSQETTQHNLRPSPEREIQPGVFRGYGMASMWYGIGFGAGIEDTCTCIAELNEDGTATIYFGTVDYGNGSNTAFSMIAAETLGLPVDAINVVNGDSARTPNCGSTVATKQTYTTGNAVMRACFMIRQDIQEIAGRILRCSPDEVRLGNGLARANGKALPISEISKRFRELGKPRRREGIFKAHQLTAPLDPKTGCGKAWFPMAFGTQFAEVDVNTKTGNIKVNRIVAAHYVGRCINQQAVRGQIVGGISFGVGFALWEDCKYVDGVPQNLNFDKYRLMRSTDYPEVVAIAIERDEKTGPFGAIGVGEPPTIPVAPAIANAVYDAVGIRLSSTPFTPDKVLAALAANNSRQ